VPRDPNSIRFIIIGRIIGRGRVVPTIINRRGYNPDRWRGNKNSEMSAMISVPG
jgi:hypothetical protein